MHKIAIVADSTASLPQAYIEAHDISIIPLYIHMGGETLRDLFDITPDVFYEKLPASDPLPTTSQPSAGDFVELFQKLIDGGAEGIVSTHISSGISGTVNSARLAAEQLNGFPVEIVDSKCAVAAHVFTVEAAVAARSAGGSLADVTAAAQKAVEAQRTIFAVDTLEYLYKGGRIGGAAALVGSLLQFKPLLQFVDGQIDALERVRTSNKALTRALEVIGEWVGDEPVRVLLMQSACMDKVERVQKKMGDYMNIVSSDVLPLSPVIGTHVGPGTLGIGACPVSALGD